MATAKTTTASASYITPVNNPATTVSNYTSSVRADVQDGNLVNPIRVLNTSVYTAGTPREGTTSNPTNDGNQ